MIELSKLGERFVNENGWIQNLADHEVGGVQLIFSKAGSSRSHHYHRTDDHELYVVYGEMLYLERPVGSQEKPSRRVIRAGEMVLTQAMVEHSTYFEVDTLLVSMSGQARTHENHESDLVRLAEPLPIE